MLLGCLLLRRNRFQFLTLSHLLGRAGCVGCTQRPAAVTCRNAKLVKLVKGRTEAGWHTCTQLPVNKTDEEPSADWSRVASSGGWHKRSMHGLWHVRRSCNERKRFGGTTWGRAEEPWASAGSCHVTTIEGMAVHQCPCIPIHVARVCTLCRGATAAVLLVDIWWELMWWEKLMPVQLHLKPSVWIFPL